MDVSVVTSPYLTLVNPLWRPLGGITLSNAMSFVAKVSRLTLLATEPTPSCLHSYINSQEPRKDDSLPLCI